MKNLRYVFLAFFLSFFLLSFGQTPTTQKVSNQHQIWLRYYNKIKLSDKWSFQTELENRRFTFPDRNGQMLIKSHLHRKLNDKRDVSIGLAYYSNGQSNPSSTSNLFVPEWRPFQMFSVKQKFGKSNFSHRYVIEERFKAKTKNNKIISGYKFNLRIRYRAQFDYPLINNSENKNIVKLKIFDEILINTGNGIVMNVFDHNRFYAGLNFWLSKCFSIEAAYLHIYKQRSSGFEYYNQNNVRITLFHNINY